LQFHHICFIERFHHIGGNLSIRIIYWILKNSNTYSFFNDSFNELYFKIHQMHPDILLIGSIFYNRKYYVLPISIYSHIRMQLFVYKKKNKKISI
jgi:hypothetical protein